jgi:hypothetical protein
MDQHHKLVGIFHIVYGGIGLLIGGMAVLLMLGLGVFVDTASRHESGPAAAILMFVAFVVAAITLISSVPDIIGGIALLKRQNWARILLMIVSALNLFSFPFGTALAIYTLWVLLKPESHQQMLTTAP